MCEAVLIILLNSRAEVHYQLALFNILRALCRAASGSVDRSSIKYSESSSDIGDLMKKI
jgi:hypothetical protein